MPTRSIPNCSRPQGSPGADLSPWRPPTGHPSYSFRSSRLSSRAASILTLFACLAWAPVHAAEPPVQERQQGCAGKRQDIERELRYAQESGNKARVKGLQEALAGASQCTDAGLRQEREGKVRDAQAKVKEREDELAEKQAKGKQKDIAKAQRKLDDARASLREAQAEVYR